MLDIITKSKIRQRILKLLFAHQNREFYLSEIARTIDASIGNCQRELRKMVGAGILQASQKAHLQFFSVNRANPLYRELAMIIRKTIGIEEELKSVINKISGITYAFIFGSYVKENFSVDSDIDLCIIGVVDENQLITRLKPLEKSIDREVNYHMYSEKDFKIKFKKDSFLKNIIKDHLLLTDNQDDFRRLLQ